MKGYTQIYTGNGKGKTTAALGLALRAAGAGLNVFIAQFLKSGEYSEIKALQRFSDQITVEQYGSGRFVKGRPTPEEIEAGRNGLKRAKAAMMSGNYDVVIFEEANVAVGCGLFSAEEISEIMDIKPDPVELIITGRGAAQLLIDKADLVTEMREIRHYYQNGVSARVGIEK